MLCTLLINRNHIGFITSEKANANIERACMYILYVGSIAKKFEVLCNIIIGDVEVNEHFSVLGEPQQHSLPRLSIPYSSS